MKYKVICGLHQKAEVIVIHDKVNIGGSSRTTIKCKECKEVLGKHDIVGFGLYDHGVLAPYVDDDDL